MKAHQNEKNSEEKRASENKRPHENERPGEWKLLSVREVVRARTQQQKWLNAVS
jgi:hypothetical protein